MFLSCWTERLAGRADDGEAIVVDERGLSIFDALRFRLRDCTALLADLLRGTCDGIAFNRHFAGDGGIIFKHACALGCEGIVSKRLGSPYRAGRTDQWLNPEAPAVRRDREIDWAKR